MNTPHSIRETVLLVTPTISASCSCVSPRFFRSLWIFLPPALKSILHHLDICVSIMPRFAYYIHFAADKSIRNKYN